MLLGINSNAANLDIAVQVVHDAGFNVSKEQLQTYLGTSDPDSLDELAGGGEVGCYADCVYEA